MANPPSPACRLVLLAEFQRGQAGVFAEQLREGALVAEAETGGDGGDGFAGMQQRVAGRLDAGFDQEVLHAQSEHILEFAMQLPR